MPRFYDHKKPYIGFVDSGRRWTHHEAPKISVNYITDCSVEVIESKTGKSLSNDGRSRISKRSLFRRYMSIKNKLPNIDRDSDGLQMMYADEKLKATDFQVCKLIKLSKRRLVIFTQFVIVLFRIYLFIYL